MGETFGEKIQGLLRLINANLEKTGLVTNVNVRTGDLRDPKQPITIGYCIKPDINLHKFAREYAELTRPLEKILTEQYSGVIEIVCNTREPGPRQDESYEQPAYQEAEQRTNAEFESRDPNHRSITLKLESELQFEVLRFKYDLILMINDKIADYLYKRGISQARFVAIDKNNPHRKKIV